MDGPCNHSGSAANHVRGSLAAQPLHRLRARLRLCLNMMSVVSVIIVIRLTYSIVININDNYTKT